MALEIVNQDSKTRLLLNRPSAEWDHRFKNELQSRNGDELSNISSTMVKEPKMRFSEKILSRMNGVEHCQRNEFTEKWWR